MTKKRKIAALALAGICAINVFSMYGCIKDNGKMNSEELKIAYQDLYKTEQVKSAPLSGATLYKASYGYTLMDEQGYNCFRYQYEENGVYYDMLYQNGHWEANGASMDGGRMTSDGKTEAVRAFSVPVTGKAHIYGNPQLISGESATISVILDGKILAEYQVDKAEGIYHSHVVDLIAGGTVLFVVSGQAEVYWNPTVDYTLAKEVILHQSQDGYYGDVHPFYEPNSGKMYMFNMASGMQQETKIEQFASLLSVSNDFIHYTPMPIYADKENSPEVHYYVVAVYQSKDGKYRSSFGANGYVGTTVSDDLINWSNGAIPYVDDSDGLYKYKYRIYWDQGVHSGRDPDIFYDIDSDKDYCIVMNYFTPQQKNGEKWLSLYTGDGNGLFSSKSVKLIDFTGRGDPECPQIKKIGDRWYIFYSETGTGTGGGVGRFAYRMGDVGESPDRVDWNSKPEYYLDGGDLHAAQISPVGDKFYMYGWINYLPHSGVWGGYLNLPREVYIKENGMLATRCDPMLSSLLNMGLVARMDDTNSTLNGMEYNMQAFEVMGTSGKAVLSGDYGRSYITAKIDLPANAKSAGITLEEKSMTYHVRLRRKNGELYLYIESGTNGCEIKLLNPTLTSFDLKIVADGQFIEAFVNDEYSLTANTNLTGNYKIGAAGEGTGATVSDIQISKLADSNNIYV